MNVVNETGKQKVKKQEEQLNEKIKLEELTEV